MFKVFSCVAFLLFLVESEVIPTKIIQFIENFNTALNEFRSSVSIEKALVQNFQNDSAVNKDNATTIYLSLAREMYSLHEDIRAEFEKIESVFNQTSQQDPQKAEMNFPVDKNFVLTNVEKLKDVNTKIQKQMKELSEKAITELKPVMNVLSDTALKLVKLGSLFNQEAKDAFEKEASVTQSGS